MSLGTVFLRPQILTRQNEAEEWRLADTAAELASRLMQDALDEGPALQKIAGVMQACAQDLAREVENRLENAAGKTRELFESVFAGITEQLDIGDNDDGLEGVVEALASLIEFIVALPENLGADQLEQRLNELGEIVENDLGLTPNRLCDFIKDCIDRAVEALTADYLAGAQTAEAKNNFLIGSSLSSIKAAMVEHAEVFSFDRQELFDDLIAELRRRKWDERLQKISETTTELGTGIGKLAPFLSPLAIGSNSNSAPVPSSSATAPATATASGAPPATAPAPATAPGAALNDPMSWYASWFFDEVKGAADRFRLEDESYFSEMSFKRLSPEFMEHWAHFSLAAADLSEALLHGLAMEKGNRLSHLFNLIHQGGYGIFTLAAYGHKGEDWLDVFKVLENKYFKALTPLVPTIAGSFESYPGTFRAWFISTFLPDVIDMLGNAGLTSKVRDIALSFLTLLNADPDNKPDSKNHEKVDGFAALFAFFGAWLAAHTIRRRDLYFFPSHGGGGTFALHTLFASLMVFGSQIIGWLLGGAIAGKLSSSFWDTKNWILSVLFSPVSFFANWYGAWEGETDEGKAGLLITRDAGGNVVNRPVAFAGYPDRASSPYKLPFEKGELELCPQGNSGFFSHNFHTNQIYAYDFAMDHNSEVLAMRGGIVEKFKDEIPDNSRERENFVVIRHDDPAEGPLPNPTHDVRESGKVVTTKAWYLHGRQFGVRHAFAARGIPENYIVGSKIKQGNQVMFSDNTGISAFNHLHVHVGTDNCVGEVRTIPLVFRDVRGDGVPQHNHYYESDNEKTGEVRETALYHPDAYRSEVIRQNRQKVCGGTARRTIQSSGIDSITLDAFASAKDDAYKNCFARVWFAGASGTVTQAKRITAYDGGSKKATIAGTWNPRPPAGSDFEIVCLTRESGSNFVVLDPRASSEDGAYKDAHIFIRFTDASGAEIYYYKKIAGYDAKKKKVTIDGEWDPPPPEGSTFRIGMPPYSRANGFNKIFGYLAQNSEDFADGRAAYKYVQVATYHRETEHGTVQGGGHLSGNFFILANSASATDNVYNGRHVIIKRGSNVVQYKKIKDYDGATRKATIDGAWDLALTTGAGGDQYFIGSTPYAAASDAEKQYAYLAPDDPAGTFAPADFGDGKKPYLYLTFDMMWR